MNLYNSLKTIFPDFSKYGFVDILITCFSESAKSGFADFLKIKEGETHDIMHSIAFLCIYVFLAYGVV